MKVLIIILAVAIIAVVVVFFILGQSSASGKAIGLIDAKLAKCPVSPNCVCSEYKNDTEHFIAPITTTNSNPTNTKTLLKNAIERMGGHIEHESENYLAATFTSAIFKFVDDLEVRIDSNENVIHLRSASRVGYSDAGVNLKRLKRLKSNLIPDAK